MTTIEAPQPRTWRVGTLVYSRAQLASVFFWLLWGDFCLHLMDNGVVPTLVPLQFEKLGASKTTYNLIAVTLVNLMYSILRCTKARRCRSYVVTPSRSRSSSFSRCR